MLSSSVGCGLRRFLATRIPGSPAHRCAGRVRTRTSPPSVSTMRHPRWRALDSRPSPNRPRAPAQAPTAAAHRIWTGGRNPIARPPEMHASLPAGAVVASDHGEVAVVCARYAIMLVARAATAGAPTLRAASRCWSAAESPSARLGNFGERAVRRPDRRAAEAPPALCATADRRLEDVTFAEELGDLRERLDLRIVHVLSQPPSDWTGERGRITTDLLQRHAPDDVSRWDFFLCGAPAPVDAGITALSEIGIPPEQVHAERFVEV